MSAVDQSRRLADAPGPRPDGDAVPAPRARFVKHLALNRLSGVYAWGALVLLFALWVPDTFLTTSTVRTIGANQAVTAIVALALVLPLATGLYDLSVASTLGTSSVLVLHLQANGMSVGLSIAVALAAGVAVGVVNGLLVVGIGISSFIATLGMSSVLAAAAFAITGGLQETAAVGSSFVEFGQGELLGVPHPVFVAVAVAVVLYYVTEWTTIGRYVYGTGGNIEAARLVGIRVDRVQTGALVASGFLAALAGVVLSARVGSSSPDIGPPYLLPAFSAVLLGATQVKTNGRVNVFGTLVAVVLLATGIYGLQLAGAPTYVSDLFNGVALILAVSIAVRINRRA